MALVYVPDNHSPHDFPILYMLGGEGEEPENAWAILPALNALYTDPRITQVCA